MLGEFNQKYTKPSGGRQCSCKGGSSRPWLLEELLLLQQETGVSIRKSFQDEKPGRSSGFGKEFGSFQHGPALGQSQKPIAFLCSNKWHSRRGFYCSISSPRPLPARGLSPGMAWPAAQRASRHSLHPRAFELLYCRLCVHTQANNQPAGSLAAPSNSARCPSAQLTPGTPHCIASASTRHLRGSQFWPGQSLGPTEKMGSLAAKCTSELLLPPPPPGLNGSLELPTAGMKLLQPGTAIPSTVTHKGTASP